MSYWIKLVYKVINGHIILEEEAQSIL